MKVGILGGTFDPVHNGHIEIARSAMDELGLDRVALMPSGDPPHKPRTTQRADRLEMARIAAREQEGIFVDDTEIRREGITYTVDTLSRLAVEHPEVEWVYILGADALNTVDGWREFPRIARLCSFAAVARPGVDSSLTRMRARSIEQCYGTRVSLLTVGGLDISSTQVRLRNAEGKSIVPLVPAGVARYIREKGLYLCCFSEEQILKKLRQTITPRRFTHTLGVAETAQRLAPKCGVDPRRAGLAGLLHDCAKSMDLDAMKALVKANISDMDEEELNSRAILHAPTGMIVARDEYGVRDPSILSAIRRHTLGDANMSAMDALIYVSDFIEPGRDSFPGLEKARNAAEEDVYLAARVCAELTAKHLKDIGQKMHPRTQRLLQWLDERDAKF